MTVRKLLNHFQDILKLLKLRIIRDMALDSGVHIHSLGLNLEHSPHASNMSCFPIRVPSCVSNQNQLIMSKIRVKSCQNFRETISGTICLKVPKCVSSCVSTHKQLIMSLKILLNHVKTGKTWKFIETTNVPSVSGVPKCVPSCVSTYKQLFMSRMMFKSCQYLKILQIWEKSPQHLNF